MDRPGATSTRYHGRLCYGRVLWCEGASDRPGRARIHSRQIRPERKMDGWLGEPATSGRRTRLLRNTIWATGDHQRCRNQYATLQRKLPTCGVIGVGPEQCGRARRFSVRSLIEPRALSADSRVCIPAELADGRAHRTSNATREQMMAATMSNHTFGDRASPQREVLKSRTACYRHQATSFVVLADGIVQADSLKLKLRQRLKAAGDYRVGVTIAIYR